MADYIASSRRPDRSGGAAASISEIAGSRTLHRFGAVVLVAVAIGIWVFADHASITWMTLMKTVFTVAMLAQAVRWFHYGPRI